MPMLAFLSHASDFAANQSACKFVSPNACPKDYLLGVSAPCNPERSQAQTPGQVACFRVEITAKTLKIRPNSLYNVCGLFPVCEQEEY
jgi:hypothetical protein